MSTHCRIQSTSVLSSLSFFRSLSPPPALTPTNNIKRVIKLENSLAISKSAIASERDTLTWSGDLLSHGFRISDLWFQGRSMSIAAPWRPVTFSTVSNSVVYPWYLCMHTNINIYFKHNHVCLLCFTSLIKKRFFCFCFFSVFSPSGHWNYTPFYVFIAGSFAVRFGDHLWSWDHLRSNLGIICGFGIICGAVQFSNWVCVYRFGVSFGIRSALVGHRTRSLPFLKKYKVQII